MSTAIRGIRNTTLRHLSRHFSDQASSWLSVPGNPLIKWPTQPHNLLNPTPASLQQQNPNPTSNDDVERDCATISDLLKDHTITSPTHLESALNKTGIKPTPPLLQTLFTKFDSSPTPLFTLFQWAHKQQPSSTAPLLNPMIDLLGKSRNFDTAWSLLLLHHPSHTTLDTFAILIRRYARAGERHMKNHFQGVPVGSLNGDFSGHESSSRFLGRKRSNSDSAFMGLGATDKMPKMGSESLESLHLMKMLRSNVVEEHPRRSHDEELAFGMQLPKADSTSHHISQPVASKSERSLIHVGALAQYPSRFAHHTTYPDKLSSRDSKAGPSIISPPAADEGSRTGKRGSGIFSAINVTNGAERNKSEALISSLRPNSGPQSDNPEPSDPPREPGLKSVSRQMTIFYGGQAHVFDEVPPNKADVIMALAGSSGGSWSTSYAPKPSQHPSHNGIYIPNRDNGAGFRNVAQEQQGKLTIPGKPVQRFNQGGPVPATIGDPLNTMSGGHLGSITLRPARPFNQPAEPNRKEKHEV